MYVCVFAYVGAYINHTCICVYVGMYILSHENKKGFIKSIRVSYVYFLSKIFFKIKWT